MKNVIINELGREIEFKPNAIFEKYLKLTEKDVRPLFARAVRVKRCPACGGKVSAPAFKKFSQAYVECQKCSTLYTAACPSDGKIRNYYRYSPAALFWRETLTRSTSGKRREKIYSPRLQWIRDMAEERLGQAESIGNFNSKNPGFDLELLGSHYFTEKFIVNPYYEESDASVLPKGGLDLITLFEVIDYTSDLKGLFDQVRAQLRAGGLCFLTTISISGFDLQVLWERSKSIFPPDRLNVFSRQGLEILAKKNGFEIIEYSTPGVLDVDVVRSAIRREPGLAAPRFIRTMLCGEDEQLDHDLQTFLQINRLSSFVRMVLKKI